MSNLYWLDQIKPEQHLLVGDKALHLSYLAPLGYAVVPGFVVSASLFREFLATINWLEPLFADLANSALHLNVKNSRQLQAIARQIRQTIATAPVPEAWMQQLMAAVHQLALTVPSSRPLALILRSSLAVPSAMLPHGAAPQFRTTIAPEAVSLFEAQVCWTDPAALALGLKQAWAELFRARNLLYWQRSHIALPQINLAVLIQPLIPAVASGAMLLHNGQLEVQVTPGVGMLLDRGEAMPDVYHIDVQHNRIQTQQLHLQTIAYQVRGHEAGLALELPPPANLTVTSPLQTYQLSDQHSPIAPPDLMQLGPLAHQLGQDFNGPLRLEWVLDPALPVGARLLLMQLAPHLTQYAASSEPTAPISAERGASSAHHPIALGLPAIAVGLAAAPGQAVARAVVITPGQPRLPLAAQTILVAANFTPDWLPLLSQVVGVIAEQGGMTSHGAIIARELGIPAVVGATGCIQKIVTGDWVWVDGDRGQVYRARQPASGRGADPRVEAAADLPTRKLPLEKLSTGSHSPLISPATQVMVSLSQPEALDQAANLPVAGIGLLRSELMALAILDQQHPTQWLQTGRRAELVERWASQINKFVQAVAPRPVFYRTLDLRSHEFPALRGSPPHEGVTMLGMRGTLSYQLNPDLFDIELAALGQVYAAGANNLRLILPFVRTVEEFVFCRQRIEQAGLLQAPNFELWIMAEVPSVLFLLPEYVQAGVQGIVIGTNDLTQLLLGVDRDQSIMAPAFNQVQPAVVRAIMQLIQTAQTLGIPCSICGQAPAQHPELIAPWVQAGVNVISVSLDAVPATLSAVAQAS